MVDVDKAVVARCKRQGVNFEILVDCDKALDFKAGKNIPIKDILAHEEIFSDSKKGMESSHTDLKKAFDTDNALEVAKKILEKGVIQVTAEHKNRIRDLKAKKIINIIHRNGINPETNAPHPLERIEAAMRDAKVKVDERKTVEEQVHDILKKLKPIIPIKFAIKEVEIIVPGKYTGKTSPLLKAYGMITKEKWNDDGSHLAVVEIPGGLEEEFMNRLNSVTHGDMEYRILNTK